MQFNKLNTEIYKDKVLGMLLMGTYGDALGAPHEAEGLNAKVQDPRHANQLKPISQYPLQDPSNGPWWIWPRPPEPGKQNGEIDASIKGLPTDDSSYRLTILHKWICTLVDSGATPNEQSFIEFVNQELQVKIPEEAPTWKKNRKLMLEDWRQMFEAGKTYKKSHQRIETEESNYPVVFFDPKYPVIFGLFLILELAPLYVSQSTENIQDFFANFTCLDIDYGKEVTGIFAVIAVQATFHKSYKNINFNSWFINQLETHISKNSSNRLRFAFEEAKSIAKNHIYKSELNFLENVKNKIYIPSISGYDPNGLKKYNPLLFLQQITACVAYANSDTNKSLHLLASGPGDADTLPSILGSIIGLFYGADLLKNNELFQADLNHIKTCVESLFGINLKNYTDCLYRVSQNLRNN